MADGAHRLVGRDELRQVAIGTGFMAGQVGARRIVARVTGGAGERGVARAVVQELREVDAAHPSLLRSDRLGQYRRDRRIGAPVEDRERDKRDDAREQDGERQRLPRILLAARRRSGDVTVAAVLRHKLCFNVSAHVLLTALLLRRFGAARRYQLLDAGQGLQPLLLILRQALVLFRYRVVLFLRSGKHRRVVAARNFRLQTEGRRVAERAVELRVFAALSEFAKHGEFQLRRAGERGVAGGSGTGQQLHQIPLIAHRLKRLGFTHPGVTLRAGDEYLFSFLIIARLPFFVRLELMLVLLMDKLRRDSRRQRSRVRRLRDLRDRRHELQRLFRSRRSRLRRRARRRAGRVCQRDRLRDCLHERLRLVAVALAALRRERRLLTVLHTLLPVAGETGRVACRGRHKSSGGQQVIFRRARRKLGHGLVELVTMLAGRLYVHLPAGHFFKLQKRSRLDVARVWEHVCELRRLVLLRELEARLAARRGDGVAIRADDGARAAKELLTMTFGA